MLDILLGFNIEGLGLKGRTAEGAWFIGWRFSFPCLSAGLGPMLKACDVSRQRYVCFVWFVWSPVAFPLALRHHDSDKELLTSVPRVRGYLSLLLSPCGPRKATAHMTGQAAVFLLLMSCLYEG